MLLNPIMLACILIRSFECVYFAVVSFGVDGYLDMWSSSSQVGYQRYVK